MDITFAGTFTVLKPGLLVLKIDEGLLLLSTDGTEGIEGPEKDLWQIQNTYKIQKQKSSHYHSK